MSENGQVLAALSQAPSLKKRKPSVSTGSVGNGDTACNHQQISSQNSSSSLQSPSTVPGSSANPAKRLKSSTSDSDQFLKAANAMLASSPPQNQLNNVVDLTTTTTTRIPSVYDPKPAGSYWQVPKPLPSKSSGAKRLVVKNLKRTTNSIPDEYVQRTWSSLDTALTAIFNGDKISSSMEELYRGCENLCRADKAPLIHERLKARCQSHVSGALRENIASMISRTDEDMVRNVESAWRKWQEQLKIIRSIFFYLDRSYLYPTPGRESIWDMGLQLFSTYIVTDIKFRPKFLTGIFSLYERDRRGQVEMENTNLLIASIRILSNLGLYSSLFEPRFLDVSEQYYRILAEEESQMDDVAAYARECASQIEKEVVRTEKYHLESSTKRQLIETIEKEMILNRMSHLTDQPGFADLLTKNDVESLSILYSIIDRVQKAGATLRVQWAQWIKQSGAAIVVDLERETEMVPRLLELKHTLDNLLANSFKKNEILSHSLRESFETFINEQRKGVGYKNNSKPSEMIAKYMDLILRTGVKALPATGGQEDDENRGMGDEDVQLNTQLDQALDLFRFIHGKDVFEAFYKKDLARRLLLGRSASADAEKTMLSKLKTECGSQFTMNLEIMFKDMDISKENMNSFKNSKSGVDRADGVDLHVTVLAQAAWPTYPETTLALPVGLAQHIEAYHQYYTSKHKGRKLAWRHALAHSVIKANFPKGKKELVMSAFQAAVLLLFNDDSKPLSYDYIKTATSLTDPELIRTLQSLACGKLRPLLKTPKGKDVHTTDTFAVNLAFTDAKFRIKINQIQLKETKEENNQTHEQVAQDRQYETQAAIIRIMKSRKTIKHVDLITETIKQTQKRGTLDMADIKKNIERLIDKDYMERSENNSYTYVA